jgi:hypothetical protein
LVEKKKKKGKRRSGTHLIVITIVRVNIPFVSPDIDLLFLLSFFVFVLYTDLLY